MIDLQFVLRDVCRCCLGLCAVIQSVHPYEAMAREGLKPVSLKLLVDHREAMADKAAPFRAACL